MNPASPVFSYNRKDLARVKTLRESIGMSRPELARRADIGIATLYLIEDGLVDSRFSTVMKLAFALKVTPDRLLGLNTQRVA